MKTELRMMNPSIYAAEDEVDEWRQKAYERTKNMSPEEQTAFIHHRAEKLMREFHLKSAKSTGTIDTK
jgi:hypothetical protein